MNEQSEKLYDPPMPVDPANLAAENWPLRFVAGKGFVRVEPPRPTKKDRAYYNRLNARRKKNRAAKAARKASRGKK